MKNNLLAGILSILIIISICGCSTDNRTMDSSNPPTLTLSPIDETTSITIYRPPVNDFSKYEHLDEWHNLIEEKFGVDIVIEYISPLHQSAIATADYYPDAIKSGDISGFIELNVGDYVNLAVLRDAGLILPIDEYLGQNTIYQSLPAAMKSSFILPDGKTWALSTQSMYGIYSRNLKKDWLENLGLQVPSTLDQLYEVSKAFAYDDPNGNNKNDEHGMDINIRTGARMLTDIFTANECFLSSYSACSISYDYSTKAYEDAILKPGMLESLLYIQNLHTDGILHINMNWDFMERDGFGNFYDLSSYYQTDDQWEKIYSFNLHDDYPSIRALKPDSCFVLTSNVENPENALNSFVNTFLGSSEGMAMGLFGVPGLNYRSEGNKITQLTDFTSSQSMNLTGMNVNLIEADKITFESDFLEPGLMEYMISDNSLIEDFFSRNMLYTDSWFLPHSNYKTAQRGFSVAFYNYLYDIDNISPNDFIRNYKTKALEAGYDEILDDLNRDAGTLARWSYMD